MRYNKIDSSFYIQKRTELVKELIINSIVIVNSNDMMPKSGDQDFKFKQNNDLFYLTGIEQEKTILLLFTTDENEQGFEEILFILERSDAAEIWTGERLTKEQASEISGVRKVKTINEFDGYLKHLAYKKNNIYLNRNEYLNYSSDVPVKDIRFIREIKRHYPFLILRRLNPIITELRLQKENVEIEQMKKAGLITGAAFLRVLKFVKPGVFEYEIEAEITHEYIKSGANGHSYDPIVASGKDNCILHYIKNDKECKDGELIVLDFGAEYGGYTSDCSRTIPVNGKFSERQKEVYNAVLRVFKQARTLIVSGTTINKINKEVEKLIESELINLKLLTLEEIEKQDSGKPAFKKYYMHGNSHFMGLDVHDVGTKDTVLLPGMVLSCEPGIYIKEEGFGIRLENDILVTDTGQIDLLSHIPIEIEEIERYMKRP